MDKFYITTAIDYTNDVIHVGHAYQKILADALARYHRLLGDDTHFLTGTDEYGQKNEKSAKARGIEPKQFVDEISAKDKEQWKTLNVSYNRFIRTTDPDHVKFAQEFYLKSKKNGDIYLNKYDGLYCEGCEAYYEEKDLVDGKCPFHPTKEIQHLAEENYFFRLSKYQGWLEKYIVNHPEFVWPDQKRTEILSFIKGGLKDFSISRLKKNLSWGIPVPDDVNHVIYVWFDALINYLTYGIEENCWPADVHVLGKDNQRFHAIYWPAMLKSAGYDLPKTILVHDFYSLAGQRISKSLGNVILPSDLTEKYTTDGVRYFFLRYGPLTNDVDITWDKLKETYNADLANGLGNLVARVAKLGEKIGYEAKKSEQVFFIDLSDFRVDLALEKIWQKIKELDGLIDQNQPWKLDNKDLKYFLDKIVPEIQNLAFNLQPFLPETSEKILKQFSGKIVSQPPLFPRIS